MSRSYSIRPRRPRHASAALTYYYDHQDEIEAELTQDEGADERHERRKAEALVKHSGKTSHSIHRR
jgi:hypothetical protein